MFTRRAFLLTGPDGLSVTALSRFALAVTIAGRGAPRQEPADNTLRYEAK